jgi:hypothetical protein
MLRTMTMTLDELNEGCGNARSTLRTTRASFGLRQGDMWKRRYGASRARLAGWLQDF